MTNSIITPRMIQIGSEIIEWSLEFISKENENMKRPQGSQAVCPFVKPTIANDTYFLVFHPEVTGASIELVQRLLLEYADEYKRIKPSGPKSVYKKSLLVIFNNLPSQKSNILDIIHENVKNFFVSKGLMIAQFHQNCDERTVYNPEFKVYVSPHPFMAIRSMAVHDILFLKENKYWFQTFNDLYGHKFEKNKLDENTNHLEKFYIEAKEKYSI